MNLNSTEYIKKAIQLLDNDCCDMLGELEENILKDLVPSGPNEIENFYQKSFVQFSEENGFGKEYSEYLIEDASEFISGFRKCLAEAVENLSDDTKALYFEYYFDGGEECSGSIFLCTEDPQSAEDWPAHFSKDFEGPNIFQYMNYDEDAEEPDETLLYFANRYIHAKFLSAVATVLDEEKIPDIPFGFAFHDDGFVTMLRG